MLIRIQHLAIYLPVPQLDCFCQIEKRVVQLA